MQIVVHAYAILLRCSHGCTHDRQVNVCICEQVNIYHAKVAHESECLSTHLHTNLYRAEMISVHSNLVACDGVIDGFQEVKGQVSTAIDLPVVSDEP